MTYSSAHPRTSEELILLISYLSPWDLVRYPIYNSVNQPRQSLANSSRCIEHLSDHFADSILSSMESSLPSFGD